MSIEIRYTEKDWNTKSTPYLHDTKTGKDYSIILGGMAWPAITNGAMVILGESLHPNPQTKLRDIWILAELEGNYSVLFDAMSRAGWEWQCKKWYGNGFDEASIQVMHKYNRGKSAKDKVHVIDAPFVEEPNSFQAYWDLIGQSSSMNCKILQFGKTSYLNKIYDVAKQIELASVKPQDHIGVLAIGYALAALQVYGHGKARWGNIGYVPLNERMGI